MEHPLFELKGVAFSYPPDIAALDAVELRLEAGEHLVILGANGCGKTTLLRILGGLLFPQVGEVRAFGERVTEERLEEGSFRAFFRSRVGFVFQAPEVQLFCPSVFEEIAFGPLQLDLPQQEVVKRVEDMLELLGIERLRERAPHLLSGGEQKKVAFASVLAMSPQVLLLDEPTSALDPRTRSWLLDLLQELSGRGMSIVSTTHDLEMARRRASRIVVMNEEHHICADGNPQEVLSDLGLLTGANLLAPGEKA